MLQKAAKKRLFAFKTLLLRISSATPTDLLHSVNLCTFAVSVGKGIRPLMNLLTFKFINYG